MVHDRAYTRAKDWSKAIRKREIDRDLCCNSSCSNPRDLYDNLHQYSKNKIHCSCGLCSCKTSNKGRRRSISNAPSKNWKISDQRKLDSINYEAEADN